MPLEEPQARSRARGVMGIVTALARVRDPDRVRGEGCTTPETMGWIHRTAAEHYGSHARGLVTRSARGVLSWAYGARRRTTTFRPPSSSATATRCWSWALTSTTPEARTSPTASPAGRVRDAANRVYHATVHFPESALTDGTLRPGESASGYIGFELPKGTYLASVTYRPIGVGLDPRTSGGKGDTDRPGMS